MSISNDEHREELARDILKTFGVSEGGYAAGDHGESKHGWIVPHDFNHETYQAGDIVEGTALEAAEELGLDVPNPETCHHRDTGRGVCADCGTFLKG